MIVGSLKERVIELNSQGLGVSQIAKELSCAKATVTYHLQKAGLPSNNYVLANNPELQLAVQEAYELCKSTYKVAAQFGLPRSTVNRYIKTEIMTEEQVTQQRVKSVIEWRKRTKQKLVDYMGGACCKCGYSKSVNALQFHHTDPSQKDFGISGKSCSFEKLLQEAKKCILVCANCHAEIHESGNNKRE